MVSLFRRVSAIDVTEGKLFAEILSGKASRSFGNHFEEVQSRIIASHVALEDLAVTTSRPGRIQGLLIFKKVDRHQSPAGTPQGGNSDGGQTVMNADLEDITRDTVVPQK